MRRPSAATLAALAVILAVAGITFWQLHPSLLFLNTTPAGGDTGAHVLLPAYLRDHLLPHGRLTGWSPSWYDGFPALTFYFPLPSLLIVTLGTVLPYGVAFKLVTALGVLSLPVAAYAFGRLAGMRDPGPACLGAATLPFLFDRTFTIYGGNIASTLAGEFAFSISLSLALVFLGVVARGMRTGRHRALAAVLLAVTALCHIIPTFFALAGWAVLTLMRPERRRLWWTATTGVVGGALIGFWAIPFLARLAYTNDMGWEKITTYHHTLLPANLDWLLVLAIAGAVISVLARRPIGVFLTVMAALSAAAFVFAPQGRLWNARLLPFWFLCLFLLAGAAVAEAGSGVMWLWRERDASWMRGSEPDRWLYLESVREHLDASPADDAWITRIAGEAAAALRGLHQSGRGHGSVRPRTMLVRSDGRVDVRAGMEGEPLVEVLAYAAPERIDGDPATPQADVWSLGAVVYEALAGRPPFTGSTTLEVVTAVQSGEAAPLGSLRADLSAAVATAVDVALRRDPASRWPSAVAFAEALGATVPVAAGRAETGDHLDHTPLGRVTVPSSSIPAALVELTVTQPPSGRAGWFGAKWLGDEWLGNGRARGSLPGAVVTPLAALLAAVVFVGLPLHILPSWFPLKTNDRNFVPDWARWNYTGYERKSSYPEYRDLISTMTDVGREFGCGRAMWEYEPELDRMGTPMAPMLLPYWTHGCIDSMEGLFFESSATTPYHFLNQSELSVDPSRAQRDLPYRSLDVTAGVQHLQLLGVRYYLALSPQAQSQARADPDLTLVAVTQPHNVTYKTGVESRTWEVYQVASADEVTGMPYKPAVLTGLPKGAKPWLKTSVSWYQDTTRWDVPLAASGPADWPRVPVGDDANPPRDPVPAATVSNITTGDDRISFDVDTAGTPVLVKASYFPNWQASGAKGPWRVSPNLMVVVPTGHHVSLHYGYTPVDWIGYAVTGAGILGAVVLWWLDRSRRETGEAGAEPAEGGPESEAETSDLEAETEEPALVPVGGPPAPASPPSVEAPPGGPGPLAWDDPLSRRPKPD